uniref:Uncharacterized protein n=1 Tax=Anguilla anguilla TaxID=7936 RepID=A0A0E9UEZ5_ANGAN
MGCIILPEYYIDSYSVLQINFELKAKPRETALPHRSV